MFILKNNYNIFLYNYNIMLQKIKNSAAVKFVSKNSRIIICVIAAAVIALALIGYFRNYRRENFNTNADKPTMYMFSVDWCPHCKAAKPKFKQAAKSKGCEVNDNDDIIVSKDSDVNFKIINGEDDANKTLIAGFNIEGYPTFALVNGATEYYDGERTSGGIESWLTEKGL